MICTNCGKEVKDGDLFCSGCGARMDIKISSFHMDELKWDLDGFPEDEGVRDAEPEFNWSAVVDSPTKSSYETKISAPEEAPRKAAEAALKPAPKKEELVKPQPKVDFADKQASEESKNNKVDDAWEGPAWRVEKEAAEKRAAEESEDIDREVTVEELFRDVPERPKRASRPYDSISFEDPKGPSSLAKGVSSTMQMDEEKRKRIRKATEKKDEDFQYGNSIFSTSRGIEASEERKPAPSFDGGADAEVDEELTSADFILPLNSGSIFYTGPNPNEVDARATSADVEAAAAAYAEVEGEIETEPIHEYEQVSFDNLVIEESIPEPTAEPVREKRRPAYESTNTFVLEKVDIRDAMQEPIEQDMQGPQAFDDQEYDGFEGSYDEVYDEAYEEDPFLDRTKFMDRSEPIERASRERPSLSSGGDDVDIFLEPKNRSGEGLGALGAIFGGLRGRIPVRRHREDVDSYDYPEDTAPEEDYRDYREYEPYDDEPVYAEDIDRDPADASLYGASVENKPAPRQQVPQPTPMGARTTGSIAVDDLNRDIQAAETAIPRETADSPRAGAERFYTFNQKSEEFKALLDQEYQRLVSRIKDESDDDTILDQLEYMRRPAQKKNQEEEEAALKGLEDLDLPEFKIVYKDEDGNIIETVDEAEPSAEEVAVESAPAVEEVPEEAAEEVAAESEPAAEEVPEETSEETAEEVAEESAIQIADEPSEEESSEEIEEISDEAEDTAEDTVEETEPEEGTAEEEPTEEEDAGQVEQGEPPTFEAAEKTRAELLAEIFNNEEKSTEDAAVEDEVAEPSESQEAQRSGDNELDEFARRLHELQEEADGLTDHHGEIHDSASETPEKPEYTFARAIPTSVIETEEERNPKAAKAAEEAAARAAAEGAEAPEVTHEESKRRSSTMQLSREDYEPPVVVLEDDEIETEDLSEDEQTDSQETQEELDEKEARRRRDKKSGKGITYVDIFGDEEERAQREKEERSGRAKIVVLDILIVILLICVICAGILALAGDSAVGQKLQSLLHMGSATEETAEGDGDSEGTNGEGQGETDEESGAGAETQASQVTSAIISGAVRNANIGEIAEDTALLFSGDKDYGMEGVEFASVFTDSAWYTSGDGSNVNYLPELVGTVIEYYSKLVDRYNEGGEAVLDLVDPNSELYAELLNNIPEQDEEGNTIRHEITKLQIGEVRQDGTQFYMLVRVAQTVSNQEDPVIETKLIRMETESYKVVIEEIVNVQ